MGDKQNKKIEEIDDARNTWCIVQFIAMVCISISHANLMLEQILVAIWIVSFATWMVLFIKSIMMFLEKRRLRHNS